MDPNDLAPFVPLSDLDNPDRWTFELDLVGGTYRPDLSRHDVAITIDWNEDRAARFLAVCLCAAPSALPRQHITEAYDDALRHLRSHGVQVPAVGLATSAEVDGVMQRTGHRIRLEP